MTFLMSLELNRTKICSEAKGTFINDVPRFLAIFDLPTYLVLPYNVPFWGLFWTPLPTLMWDVINESSPSFNIKMVMFFDFLNEFVFLSIQPKLGQKLDGKI
jgi:hypothetical protein